MSTKARGLGYNLIFALALGTACAVLLTGVSAATRARREMNERARMLRQALRVLGAPFDPEWSAPRLIEEAEGLVQVDRRPSGLTMYRYTPPGGKPLVAVPFEGNGLWGPIRGFLALEADLRTIHGLVFYYDEETPGIGSRINSGPEFRDQFQGRSIVGPSGQPGLEVVPPARPLAARNQVHAISGATLTSNRVERMLDTLVRRIRAEAGGAGDDDAVRSDGDATGGGAR
jgi:Na+-transporting NADH:ubiquinone oxidoreductase subunit NqrC